MEEEEEGGLAGAGARRPGTGKEKMGGMGGCSAGAGAHKPGAGKEKMGGTEEERKTEEKEGGEEDREEGGRRGRKKKKRRKINAADVTDGDSFVTYLKVSTTAVPFEWENEARNAEEGLWSLPNPKEPWIWKKENPNFHEGAVTVVMFVTSYSMFLVIIIVWKQRIMVAVTFLVFFGSIELFYISASRTKVLVFVCVKSIQVPYVCEQERFLIGRIGPKEYGMLRHIVRYGYKDLQQENYNFENRLVSGITEFVETEGAESTSGLNTRPFSGSLSSDGEENQRCLSDFKEVTSDGLEIVENSIHRDVSLEIMRARESGVTYIIGNSHAKAKTSASILKKLAINIVYDFLGKNCRGPDVVLNVPPTSLLEVGMIYYV
ncbi:hypothetical protein MRB53_000606 [Persea americana]|uniref:Uncharacterized protein n=1 Tax=Persea americana TaxID=3435 RepID=A0ACC2MQ00_PERAE|nr:hypothetical protein MRB53_000606 [Persea americana]